MARIHPFTPIFNTANAGSADIFPDDLVPQGPDSTFLVAVGLSAAVNLNLLIKKGGVTATVAFNDAAALTATAGKTYTWAVDPAYTYNLQPAGSCTVLWCSVRDVCSGAF